MYGIKFRSYQTIEDTLWQGEFDRPFTAACIQLAREDGERGRSNPREVVLIVLDNSAIIAEIQ